MYRSFQQALDSASEETNVVQDMGISLQLTSKIMKMAQTSAHAAMVMTTKVVAEVMTRRRTKTNTRSIVLRPIFCHLEKCEIQ